MVGHTVAWVCWNSSRLNTFMLIGFGFCPTYGGTATPRMQGRFSVAWQNVLQQEASPKPLYYSRRSSADCSNADRSDSRVSWIAFDRSSFRLCRPMCGGGSAPL